jgi:hypothetical protein
MKDNQYKQLEKLLGKLGQKLPFARYCILHGHLQDGYHIAVYNHKGDLHEQNASYDIKTTVEKFKDDKDKS